LSNQTSAKGHSYLRHCISIGTLPTKVGRLSGVLIENPFKENPTPTPVAILGINFDLTPKYSARARRILS